MSLTLKIAKNSAYLALGKVLATALGVAAMAILLRYFSPADYGRYTTVFAFILLFGTLTDFGLALTATQEISLPGADIDRVLSSILTLRLTLNVALALLLPAVLSLFPYDPMIKRGILLGVVFLFTVSLFQILSSFFQKTLTAGYISLAEIAGKSFLFLLTLGAVWLRASFLMMIGAAILASVGQLALLLVFACRRVRLRLAVDWAVWQRILKKTWPLALAVVFSTIYFKGDTLVLSLTRPYGEVGIYGAAYKILEVLITLPALFMGLILPPLTAAWAGGERQKLQNILQKSWDALSLAAVPLLVGGAVLAKPIIKLAAGAGYEPAAAILRILLLATAAIFFGTLFTHAVVAVNKQRVMLGYYALTALTAMALYLIFIPRYTYYAAAVITVGAELFIALAAWRLVKKSAAFSLSGKIFAKALLGSAVMGIFLITLPPNLNILLSAPLGAIVYGFIIWLLKAVPAEFRTYLKNSFEAVARIF